MEILKYGSSAIDNLDTVVCFAQIINSLKQRPSVLFVMKPAHTFCPVMGLVLYCHLRIKKKHINNVAV